MSSIMVDLAVRGREPMSIVLPAEDVISTTLVMSNADPSLPTLLSVERIVAKVGNLGIAVADERFLTALAAMVNEHYLAVAPNLWHDTEIRIDGEAPPKGADADSFRGGRCHPRASTTLGRHDHAQWIRDGQPGTSC